MITEGVVTCFVTFEADWVTDLGEVGRTELSTADVWVGDLGERGWVIFSWDTGCLTELWETFDWIPFCDEGETMLLFDTWGFYTTLCLSGFLSIFTSTNSFLSADLMLDPGWYL